MIAGIGVIGWIALVALGIQLGRAAVKSRGVKLSPHRWMHHKGGKA